ncbi:bestrophin family protein [[Erwinia] mediterraneensis]|uniref:bestrophin family protein n=1 Tax=[Erwinia] mediterraneensis TaxID=2161819 RepID=UPI001031502F|nr:bestrophin family ion channel [[Erwinia] mediterraneensis]
MIVRSHSHWFIRLFAWHGSVLPDILFRLSVNLVVSLIAIFSLGWYGTLGIKLTLAPFSLLGVSIAVFLGFRNSVCYARFSEARRFLGELLIACRTLQRQVLTIAPAYTPRAQALLLAFCYALKHQLRRTDARPDLLRLLGNEADQVLARRSPANYLLLQLSQWLGEQRRQGLISDVVWSNIDQNLNQLAAVLGGCERLASMPVPFAYSLLLHRTVYLFSTLLPFALAPDLHYMTPLVSMFISYTFLSLDTLAEELEMPFGYKNNHLPMDAICTNIEISLREMAGETQLPEPLKPDHHYRLT